MRRRWADRKRQRLPGRRTVPHKSGPEVLRRIWPAVEATLLPCRSFGRQNSLRMTVVVRLPQLLRAIQDIPLPGDRVNLVSGFWLAQSPAGPIGAIARLTRVEIAQQVA